MSKHKDNEIEQKTEQPAYPHSINGVNGTFTLYNTTNSCSVTGKSSPVLYARNLDEGRAGKVYSIEALVMNRFIDDVEFLTNLDIDPKTIEKLHKNNFLLISQVELYLNDKSKLGLTDTEMQQINKILGGAK